MTYKIMPASEIRSHFAEILNGLRKESRPCFVTKSGHAVAAILSMEAYEELLSELEDRQDETDPELVHAVDEARHQFKAGQSRTLKRVPRK